MNVKNGGTITAGKDSSSIGTLHTGAQTWSNGGTFVAKIDTSSVTSSITGASGSADKLVMSGLSSVTNTTFVVNATAINGGSLAAGTTYSWVIADVTGSATAFNSFLTSLNTHLTTTNFSGGTASLTTKGDGGGEDLVFDYTTNAAAPELTSCILFGAVASPLLLGRRRRRDADEQADAFFA